MLDDTIFSQRERTKIEGFGKPLDLNRVGGGSLDWFMTRGLPFDEWDKPCHWYTCDDDESPVFIVPRKALLPGHGDEAADVLG
jgi:hypothetical protein